MDTVSAKKVVALKRQKGVYDSMLKKGDITQDERDALVKDLEAQVERVRSQLTLPLAGVAAGGKEKK